MKLQESLDNTTSFPSEYLYKFIVPTNANQVIEVEEIFKEELIKMVVNESKTGKYMSISIHVTLSSSFEVISYYQRAETIEGIISL